MRVAITGAEGFMGWHARCALKARGDDVVAIGRETIADRLRLDDALRGVDALLHLAGVNRGEADRLRVDNMSIARALTDSLDRVGGRARVVFANSIQSGNGTPFGDGKQAAADHLAAWAGRTGTTVVDVRLPNLFGEHGRPHYNSVVATFCQELANGGRPVVREDREIPLLHVQDALAGMLELVGADASGVERPAGRTMAVSKVLDLLTDFRDLYGIGEIPDINDPLHLALFNTYRSFCFPHRFPIYPHGRADHRGNLVECVKAHGGQAQVFCSTTYPGSTRGEHFHLRKVERFIVLGGTAEIALRRLFDDEIVRFEVSGDIPAIVDMPTMWAHSITNTGITELMTLFWANEILDPAHPDTFAESVGRSAVVGELGG